MNEAESRGLHYGWIVLGMGTLVVFAALGLARFGYSMVLPPMQAGLALDNTQAGALATVNLIGYLVLSALGGAAASRFGPRAVIVTGLAVAASGMVLTGLAQGFAGAAAWRGVTGLGSGASNVPVMGLMAAWFAPRRRGLASGVAVAGSSIALIALGPSVPAILAQYGDTGWRACWFIFAAATLLLAILALLLLRNSPTAVGLRPVGATEEATDASAASAAPAWGLVYRRRAVWHLGLVYVAFGFAYVIYITFFVKYLVGEAGYSQAEAGRLFMTMGWFSLLCGLIWGSVSDAIGRRGAMAIVYVIQAVSFALFGFDSGATGITISAILFGLTAWSIPAIVAAGCGDICGSRLAPAALGFVTLFFGIGQAAGPVAAGAIADATGSLQPAMLLAAGVSILGVLGSITLRPTKIGQHSH
ncbi:MAG: YbfB/YjiJ family MFS transporter [candidate division WS1 bacterium]|nr:YbfB/YjiJ family MFS transporter [candidate division WS1 bacterium]